jgi:hypothetical protein
MIRPISFIAILTANVHKHKSISNGFPSHISYLGQWILYYIVSSMYRLEATATVHLLLMQVLLKELLLNQTTSNY